MIPFQHMQRCIDLQIQQQMNERSLAKEQYPRLTILEALGRVVAEDIRSPIYLPHFNVSAMDGFAFHHDSLTGTNQTLTLVGEAVAGQGFDGVIKHGECVRIMTGAPVPNDCDTVEMKENTTVNNSADIMQVTFNQAVKTGANIRIKGEEITLNEIVLAKGHLITPADVMLLASMGLNEVAVFPRVKVGVFSCGNELVDLGVALSQDQIYDSNRPTLFALLKELPVEVIDLGIVPDDLTALTDTVHLAMKSCDVLISTAGVSAGEYDYLRTVIGDLGTISHYKVAMKPGKPFVLGQLPRTDDVSFLSYFGLPGNPVATFVCFEQLLKPALWQLSGVSTLPTPVEVRAVLTTPVKKSAGRMDFQRAILTADEGSVTGWTVRGIGAQDSHRVKGVSQANALMVLPLESTGHAIGDIVAVQMMSATLQAIHQK